MDSDLKPAPDIIPSGTDKSDTDGQPFEQKKPDEEAEKRSDTADKHERRKTPKSAQDVYNKKVNNMHVSGNIADSQQFIQNATIFQVPNLKDLIKLANDSTVATNESDKTYDLADPRDFGEYISKYKNNWHVTFAIILCVFDYIDLDDLKTLKDSLTEFMPPAHDKAGKAVKAQDNLYIPIDQMLAMVGGHPYEKDGNKNLIGLGESREAALVNLWGQFPSLREIVIKWLYEVSKIYSEKTVFNGIQVAYAFANIIKLDYNVGIRHILPRLYSDENNVWLIGSILIILVREPEYMQRIREMILVLLRSGSKWLWKAALNIFNNSNVEQLGDEVIGEIEKRINAELDPDNDGSINLIGMSLIVSERLRDLVLGILCSRSRQTKTLNEDLICAEVYFECILSAYNMVSAQHHDLPLVSCDTKAQLNMTRDLVSRLMSRHHYRRYFMMLLSVYLQEISEYTVSPVTVNRLKAFFLSLIGGNPEHRYEALTMLGKTEGKIAGEILAFLNTKINKC